MKRLGWSQTDPIPPSDHLLDGDDPGTYGRFCMLLIKSESRLHQVIPTHEVIAAVLIMKRGQDAACIRWIQPILVIFGCLPKTPQTCIHGKITRRSPNGFTPDLGCRNQSMTRLGAQIKRGRLAHVRPWSSRVMQITRYTGRPSYRPVTPHRCALLPSTLRDTYPLQLRLCYTHRSSIGSLLTAVRALGNNDSDQPSPSPIPSAVLRPG